MTEQDTNNDRLENPHQFTQVPPAGESREEQDRGSPWLLPAAAAAALVVGLLGGYFGRPQVDRMLGREDPAAEAEVNPQGQPAARPTLSPEQEAQRQRVMETLISETRHFKGNPEAAVTVIEFSDFQCGYCGSFYRETEVRLDENYISEGEVRFGYWHFPFLGAGSQLAAEASECAADQEAFWPYHDRLFSGEINQFSAQNLKALAGDLDLDREVFDQCLDSGKHTEFVQAQRGLAQQIGVQSTPTFLVNGRPVIGAQPYEVFSEVIQGILAEDQG
jgi:protein-disulfide isomerase